MADNLGTDLEAHETIIAAVLGVIASVFATIVKFFRGRPPKDGHVTIEDVAQKLDEHSVSDLEAQTRIESGLRELKADIKGWLGNIEERQAARHEEIHDRLLTLERRNVQHDPIEDAERRRVQGRDDEADERRRTPKGKQE